MLYAQEIDNGVIRQLVSQEALSYNELKRKVEGYLSRPKGIPSETFSFHIKRLCTVGAISKLDSAQRGSQVYYALRGKARIKHNLSILTGNQKELFLQLYRALLFYEHRPVAIPLPEEKLDEFLANFNKSTKDLKVSEPPVKEGHMTVTSISVASEVELWKVEHDKPSPLDGFMYRILGFSIKEFLNRHKFGYDNSEFTFEEVRGAFERLAESGLIREIFRFNGESRYVVADQTLRTMIREIWRIRDLEWMRVMDVWDYLRRPSESERIWMEKLHGKVEAQKLFDYHALRRRDFNRKSDERWYKKDVQKRTKKLEKEIDQKVIELWAKYGGVIANYRYLQESLAIVVPRIFSVNRPSES